MTRLTTQLGASTFDLTGSVLRQRGVRGRHVKLQASTPKPADLGDVMRLLVDGRNAPLTGRLGLRARLDIPPGENDVQDRLTVDGSFDVSQARFRDREIQERIDVLSRRGQGRPADPTIAGVAAEMEGQAVLRRRDLALREVRFVVPGVAIEMSGSYGLSSQRLDFHGIARLDATLLADADRGQAIAAATARSAAAQGRRRHAPGGGHRRHARGAEGRREPSRVAAQPAVSLEVGGDGVDDGIRTRDSRSHSPELYH